MRIPKLLAVLSAAALIGAAAPAYAETYTVMVENNTSFTINDIYFDTNEDPNVFETGASLLDERPIESGSESYMTLEDTGECEVDLVVATSSEYIPLENYFICPDGGFISFIDSDLAVDGSDTEESSPDEAVAEDDVSAGSECDFDQMVLVVNQSSKPIVELYAYHDEAAEEDIADWLTEGPLEPGADINIHPNDGSGIETYHLFAHAEDGYFATGDINLCQTDLVWTITDEILEEEGDY